MIDFVKVVTFSATFVAIFCNSLTTVVKFFGGVLAPIICFVFPSMFYLKLENVPLNSRKKIICIVNLVVVTIYILYGTYDLIA